MESLKTVSIPALLKATPSKVMQPTASSFLLALLTLLAFYPLGLFP
jgi:hypothetical protein